MSKHTQGVSTGANYTTAGRPNGMPTIYCARLRHTESVPRNQNPPYYSTTAVVSARYRNEPKYGRDHLLVGDWPNSMTIFNAKSTAALRVVEGFPVSDGRFHGRGGSAHLLEKQTHIAGDRTRRVGIPQLYSTKARYLGVPVIFPGLKCSVPTTANKKKCNSNGTLQV